MDSARPRRVSTSSPSRVLPADSQMQCTLADLDVIFKDTQEVPQPGQSSKEARRPRSSKNKVKSRRKKSGVKKTKDKLINSLENNPILELDDVPEPCTASFTEPQ